jgi:glycosyltransferase involved in cell wall biosynthesis
VPLIDVVLPCLNEAAALPWVLKRIPAQAHAIVVDNGSTDDSAFVARSLHAEVVTCLRRGYGSACAAGIAAATAEYVVICDCDGTIDPGDAVKMLKQLEAGADLVVGRRRPVSHEAWSWPARIANHELARRIRKRTGLRISDMGPIRMARRTALLSLGQVDERSGYPVETLVLAAAAGWRVEQVDVVYRPRIGKSKVTGTVRGSVQAVRDMSRILRA